MEEDAPGATLTLVQPQQHIHVCKVQWDIHCMSTAALCVAPFLCCCTHYSIILGSICDRIASNIARKPVQRLCKEVPWWARASQGMEEECSDSPPLRKG